MSLSLTRSIGVTIRSETTAKHTGTASIGPPGIRRAQHPVLGRPQRAPALVGRETHPVSMPDDSSAAATCDVQPSTVGAALEPAVSDPADPLVHREDVRLAGEDLLEQHPVDLLVGVGAAVTQDDERVVEVGGLPQRREHRPRCVAMPARTRVRTPRDRSTMSRSLPAKALTRFLVTTMSLGCGATAGWIQRARRVLGKSRGPRQCGEGAVVRIHLGGAGPERDPDVDDLDPVCPCRRGSPVDRCEQRLPASVNRSTMEAWTSMSNSAASGMAVIVAR